nr:spindle and kinetochore-associated protein 1 homolog [Ipomoea batatas]
MVDQPRKQLREQKGKLGDPIFAPGSGGVSLPSPHLKGWGEGLQKYPPLRGHHGPASSGGAFPGEPVRLSEESAKKLQTLAANMPLNLSGRMTYTTQDTIKCVQPEPCKDDLSFESLKVEEPAPREKKGRAPPPLWYLSVDDLNYCPAYMRGRLTLDKVNAANNDMAMYAEANSQLITAPRKKLTENIIERAMVSQLNLAYMVEDEWGMICLKEKVGKIGYTMDDSLSYFIGTEVGLQELVKDLNVWNLVNQSCSPKVIEIWLVKKGNGDDVDECAGSAEEEFDGSGDEWDSSGEESDDRSVEDYNSDGLVNVVVNGDADFDKNIDVNAEYGGLVMKLKPKSKSLLLLFRLVMMPKPKSLLLLSRLGMKPKPKSLLLLSSLVDEAQVQVQVPVSALQIGDKTQAQAQVAVEPEVITQPEVEDNPCEILDDILDAHWHEIEIHTQNNLVARGFTQYQL